MKSFRFLTTLALIAASTLFTQAQTNTGFAPTNLSSTFFNGQLTGSTGGANPTGMISLFLGSDGLDYSVGGNGQLTSPVSYTYTKTGANTATIVEPQGQGQPPLTITLTFTSATAGTFAADYGSGKTQSGTFSTSAVPFKAPVVNMSNRVMIKAGEMAIPGFVIGGNAPRRVLMRAVGPGLSQFQLTQLLPNPIIQVFRGQTAIASNDDWGSDTSVAAAFAQAGAFSLTPGSKDAALVTTLTPGAYTAFIKGSTATEQGEVLIELYYLD
ncbi:MAG TPA: hypothetical protein PLN52_04290 [Opitutaceae bacterium]|nr:hypothetical protein [Opitutaceae bacterium]